MLDFFDCNVVLGNVAAPPPGGALDTAKLLAEMDRYGINEALVYHHVSKRGDPARGNGLVVEAVAASKRLHPSWMLLPPATQETPPLDSLGEAMMKARVHAVRLAPDDANHMYSLAPVVCGTMFEWLARHKVPVFIEQMAVSWRDIDALMEDYPHLRLVLVDVAYRISRDLYPRLEAYPHLHVETSGLQQHCGLADMVERFGAERFLFGSRMPYFCAGAAKHLVEHAAISDEAKRAIAGGNLQRLLAETALG